MFAPTAHAHRAVAAVCIRKRFSRPHTGCESSVSRALRRSSFLCLSCRAGQFFCSHFSHAAVVFGERLLQLFQNRCYLGVACVRELSTEITNAIFEPAPGLCGLVIHGIGSTWMEGSLLKTFLL